MNRMVLPGQMFTIASRSEFVPESLSFVTSKLLVQPLFSAKLMDVAPGELAVTLYEPAVPLAETESEAVPFAFVNTATVVGGAMLAPVVGAV